MTDSPEKSRHAAKRVWACAIGLVVVAVAAILAVGARPKEPSYAGRSLSAWLRTLHNPKSSPIQQETAKTAIRGMGTNLIPCLVLGMGRPDQSWLDRFVRPARELGLRYQLPMHLAWSSAGLLRLSVADLDEPTKREAARDLFTAYLEERARSDPNNQTRQNRIALCLFSCGDRFPDLLFVSLTNTQPRFREGAASLVGYVNGMPTNFIGALADRLSDPAPGVRGQAAVSLARFRKDAQRVVPLISHGLGDSEASVRRAAIDSLRRFGPQARPALPELEALAERDLDNRALAIECIRGIDWAEADRLAQKFHANR